MPRDNAVHISVVERILCLISQCHNPYTCRIACVCVSIVVRRGICHASARSQSPSYKCCWHKAAVDQTQTSSRTRIMAANVERLRECTDSDSLCRWRSVKVTCRTQGCWRRGLQLLSPSELGTLTVLPARASSPVVLFNRPRYIDCTSL